MYTPCFRMAGSTSAVTHRRNFFAPGSLLDSTREYRPDSLMMVIPRFGISKVAFPAPPANPSF